MVCSDYSEIINSVTASRLVCRLFRKIRGERDLIFSSRKKLAFVVFLAKRRISWPTGDYHLGLWLQDPNGLERREARAGLRRRFPTSGKGYYLGGERIMGSTVRMGEFFMPIDAAKLHDCERDARGKVKMPPKSWKKRRCVDIFYTHRCVVNLIANGDPQVYECAKKIGIEQLPAAGEILARVEHCEQERQGFFQSVYTGKARQSGDSAAAQQQRILLDDLVAAFDVYLAKASGSVGLSSSVDLLDREIPHPQTSSAMYIDTRYYFMKKIGSTDDWDEEDEAGDQDEQPESKRRKIDSGDGVGAVGGGGTRGSSGNGAGGQALSRRGSGAENKEIIGDEEDDLLAD